MPVMMAKEMDTGCEALSITVDKCHRRTESEPPGGEPGLCRRDRREKNGCFTITMHRTGAPRAGDAR